MSLVSFLRLPAHRFFLLFAFTAFGLAPLMRAQAPSAVDGFDPDIDGVVHAVVAQPDGRLLVAGQFSTVSGMSRANLARLNADGTLDASFNPGANGPVRAVIVQRDGRIVLGGDFTTLQPGGAGNPVSRNRLARLNADGTLDASFNPGVTGQLQPQVYALLLQGDGKIVVGGSFSAVGGVSRNNLARLHVDGTTDTSFNPNANSIVLALALHVDNKILVGGGFTALQPNGAASATTRNRIARLTSTGALDTGFDPGANNGVTALAVQRDGGILLAGHFTALQPASGSVSRSRLARLRVDGSIDEAFNSRVDGSVAAVVVQADGGILVGGAFNSVWGRGATSVIRGNIARFLPDGSLDSDFAPSINGAVSAIALQSDGKAVLGGLFTRATPSGASAPLVRNHIARFNVDGSLDSSFELAPGGRPLASVTQVDGKVIIAGSFTSVGGLMRNHLARLNADGSLDTAYTPDFNGRVYALALQSDGRLLVSGVFTAINGERRDRLARLNVDGTLDASFNPHFDGMVGAIVIQPDGKIIVGGTFSNITPARATTAERRSNLARLNADGTLDTAFDPNPNSAVSIVVRQADGKILAGGAFTTLWPGGSTNTSSALAAHSYIVRLNADGTIDTAFNPGTNGHVSAIALQGDGKIVVGGAFTTVHPSGNGSGATRNRLARFNADGTLDTAFDPNANDNVLVLAIQSDGRILAGGPFTTLQPNGAAEATPRKYAARLNADGTVDASFNLDLSEQPGNRVDSLRIHSDGRLYVGGSFLSLQPLGTSPRISRQHFVRLAANGSVDTAFDPAAGGSSSAVVHALALQSDGRILAAGEFSDLGGARSVNVARFRPEGGPDATFSPTLTADGAVRAVAVRPVGAPVATQLSGFAWLGAGGAPHAAFAASARLRGEVWTIATDREGRLLLGGSFVNIDNPAIANIARFSTSGVLDTGFAPAPNGAVSGIVVQPDGRIIAVGSFTTVSGQARNRIARIDANGALDVTYDPSANGRVDALALQGDGKLLVGGAFTAFTPNLTTTPVTRNYLARLNADGTLDTAYNPSPSYEVAAISLLSDGRAVVGGSFNGFAPNGATTTTERNYLARLNADGTLDQNFNPAPNAPVAALLPLASGQLLVGGGFTSIGGVSRNNLARLNAAGTVETSFNPSPNGAVTSIARQTDGSILLGGLFTTLQPDGLAAPVTRNRIARISAEGALDTGFSPDIRGAIRVVAARSDGAVLVGGGFSTLQINGSIVVGGDFSTIGGIAARHLAMLNDNGTVSPSFLPQPNGAVHAILALSDGSTLVGGAFTSIAGSSRSRLARFNVDGTLDASYTAPAAGTVRALALQPDGKVLVGGTGLVRFGASGSPDATFAASVTGTVTALAVQADGRILYATDQASLARLNADGSPDTSFSAPAGSVIALAVQADGRILVAGSPARLVRLNANGTPDASFNPAPNGSVTALALQTDGRLMIGGRFSRLGSTVRSGIARLASDGTASQALGVSADRSSVVLNRTGSLGEVSAVIFEHSSDRLTWARLGDGLRVPGTSNWRRNGLSLPASGSFYIRARILAPATSGISTGMLETVREFNFASPVPGLDVPAAIAASPAQIAAEFQIDAATGIVPRAVISTVPGAGTVEITVGAAAPVSFVDGGSARLINLSTRGRVTAVEPLILGFAIAGDEPRRVLVRGVGPGLATFGVEGALSAARLQVFNATGTEIARGESGGVTAEAAGVAAATGAFPLAGSSADSALVLTLPPGLYTARIVDPKGGAGVALAEIYDAGSGPGASLVNVSSRGAAGRGAEALISGFVIGGDSPARVLLRGVGPQLLRYGVTNAVTDPSIALYDNAGQMLGANDNWVSSTGDIAAAALRAGAFALEAGSKDAAVLATLPAGAYTMQVSGESAGTAALLEIYQVR